MRTIYLRKDIQSHGVNHRKVLVDMAYLASYKKIRLLKHLYEEGLYLPFYNDPKNLNRVDKYLLTKDKIFKEDEHHYFFDFPFKREQVEAAAV